MGSNKLLVLGATGGTGQQVLSQALQQGHQVTALVRSRERLTLTSDRLRVLSGSVTDDGRLLAEAVLGQDAVISTLGVGTSLKSSALIARSVSAIVRAMESQGVRRLIFTSAYGVGQTRRDVPLLPRIFMRLLLGDVYADKEAGEDELRRSGVDWTLIHPVTLTNGPGTGRYRVGERLTLHGFPQVPAGSPRGRRPFHPHASRGSDLREEGCAHQLLTRAVRAGPRATAWGEPFGG